MFVSMPVFRLFVCPVSLLALLLVPLFHFSCTFLALLLAIIALISFDASATHLLRPLTHLIVPFWAINKRWTP